MTRLVFPPPRSGDLVFAPNRLNPPPHGWAVGKFDPADPLAGLQSQGSQGPFLAGTPLLASECIPLTRRQKSKAPFEPGDILRESAMPDYLWFVWATRDAFTVNGKSYPADTLTTCTVCTRAVGVAGQTTIAGEIVEQWSDALMNLLNLQKLGEDLRYKNVLRGLGVFEPQAVVPPNPSGCICLRCKALNPYAVPNRPNGAYLCYVCRP